MPTRLEISVHPNVADDIGIRAAVAEQLSVPADNIEHIVVRRRTVDARRRSVRVHYRVDVYAPHEAFNSQQIELPALPLPNPGPPVLIVGAGPAGLFAAWRLACLRIPCIIFERGKDVRGRRHSLAQLNREGVLQAESNYCFGEGGAGTFSDGKLYTRIKERGPIRDISEVLVGCGAPERILADARPHIGTNRLPKVITALREYLKTAGVEFRFDTRVESVDVAGNIAHGVVVDGAKIDERAVILATGHSARDVYRGLHRQGIAIEAKAFALGVRIEHPQPLIDEIQYGGLAGHTNLGAAPYSLKRTSKDVGVYSFCMCPGGFIVAATTDQDHVVVNGMSPSRRNSRYANSGMVVTVDESVYGEGALAGLDFQAEIERAAFIAGGGKYVAPAQRLTDFLQNRISADLPDCSYRPGLRSADLRDVLPQRISDPLASALHYFGTDRMRGYVSEEAVVVGVESRSSAPIRILRDAATLESPTAANLYPCGEGAGFAGGIMSAAFDGVRVASAIAVK